MFEILMALIAGVGAFWALTDGGDDPRREKDAFQKIRDPKSIPQKANSSKKQNLGDVTDEEGLTFEVEAFMSSKNSVARELRQCISVPRVRNRLVLAMKIKYMNLSYEECTKKVIEDFHKDRSYYDV